VALPLLGRQFAPLLDVAADSGQSSSIPRPHHDPRRSPGVSPIGVKTHPRRSANLRFAITGVHSPKLLSRNAFRCQQTLETPCASADFGMRSRTADFCAF
jgi:hypothetical protein